MTENSETNPVDLIFGMGGHFHTKIGDNYEVRQAQVDLAKDILTAFQQKHHFIGEAPCGTGKSYGYLGPAFISIASDPAWENIEEDYDYEDETSSKDRKDSKDSTRIVIATAKISLQEQLIKKDLPAMASIFAGKDIKYCLIKGRNNFLCKEKEEQAEMSHLAELSETDKEKQIVRQILDWAKKTKTGDKSECKVNIPDSIWEKFSVSDDECKKKSCEFYESCFTKINRMQAHKSDIIVANYHIVLIDMFLKYKVGRGFLPPYTRVVFDEAHNLEEISREFFGKDISCFSTRRIVAALKDMKKPGSKADNSTEYVDLISELETENKAFWDAVERYHAKQQPKYIRTIEKGIASYDGYVLALEKAAKILNNHGHKFIETEGELSKSASKFMDRAKEAREIAEKAKSIIDQDDDTFAYWIEVSKFRKGDGSVVKLKAQPIYVKEILKAVLWDNLDSAILVSATLAEGADLTSMELANPMMKEIALNTRFQFIMNNLGLDQNTTKKFICASPFDFSSNCALVIPQEFPEPNYENQAVFRKMFLDKIQEAIIESEGRALVLFTSHAALKDFYENCHDIKKKFKVYAQGLSEENKSELVDLFKADESSVLLGTASYWEGIDCPGKSLSLLVIEKLPFAPMTDPILDALKEKDSRNFWDKEYVPRTIIKFKQGVGRLIRSKDDKGLIIVADKRAASGTQASKKYSHKVYSSVPPMPFAQSISSVRQYFEHLKI